MSQVFYARMPDALKEAVDAYAADHGFTGTRAVVELLDKGLQAASDGPLVETLETRVAALTAERDALARELRAVRAPLESLDQRTRQRVGTCPTCKEGITAHDLLITATCPHCNGGLTSLLPRLDDTPDLNGNELLIAIVALGALAGVAYLATRN